MFRDPNRPHTRPAAAVRDAKSFVQIQMTNVGAVIAGTTQTALRIHVGAVHKYLAAVGVYDVTNFADGRFKDAVCGRIRHHERSEIARVLICFGAQIG